MISLVNGFICHNYHDVTDALQGKKPPAKPGQLPYSSHSDSSIWNTDRTATQSTAASTTTQPTGAPTDTSGDKAVTTVAANAGPQTNGDTTGPAVNLLA